jgi:hypothetical protein
MSCLSSFWCSFSHCVSFAQQIWTYRARLLDRAWHLHAHLLFPHPADLRDTFLYIGRQFWSLSLQQFGDAANLLQGTR